MSAGRGTQLACEWEEALRLRVHDELHAKVLGRFGERRDAHLEHLVGQQLNAADVASATAVREGVEECFRMTLD